jgi:hypothetical protein
MGQQLVWRPSSRKGTKAGLTVWGEFGYSGPSASNTMPYFYGAGAAYQGSSLAVVRTRWSPAEFTADSANICKIKPRNRTWAAVGRPT